MVSGRNPLTVTVRALAAASASGVTSSVGVGARSSVRLALDVTTVSGTGPTLDILIETSRDLMVWRQVGAFTQVATAGTQTKVFPGCDANVRASWTVGGSGSSFTFAVTGEAVQVYVTPADVRALAMDPSTLQDVTDEQLDPWCRAASDEADDYLCRRYTMPIVSWPDSLRRHVGALVALMKMTAKGYAFPEGRDLFKDRRDEAIAWLEMAATSGVAGIVDSTPEDDECPVRVWTGELRGW